MSIYPEWIGEATGGPGGFVLIDELQVEIEDEEIEVDLDLGEIEVDILDDEIGIDLE